ncbi:serine/threonine-protein phosphatase [Streptacidiphilus sp. ASG 303]|uniref:PP2C family protein-serine/threonine phosphatase n=1 Tax=Streptacidiphilus sp. ASG 303 TaxID=2896847 RepID=UPI001E2E4428|nr:serine/threonine-protein phosphatase [Streptacidiphilus sp. ASG 303]
MGMRYRRRRASGAEQRPPAALVAVPVVLVVLITVADILSPDHIHLGPLLVVAPALTSSFAGPRLTAAVAALAVGAQVVIAVVRNSITTSNHETQIAALVLVSAFVVFFSRLQERRDAELAQVRSVSEAAQQVLLRPLPRRIGPLQVASVYLAAEDHARIGGDFYAAVRTPGGTRLLIGDVRGKGMEAVDHAALVLGAFRAAAHRNPDLPALAAHLDGAVSWNTSPHTGEAGEAFATAVLVDIPDDAPEVHLLTCGHPPPLLLRHGTAVSLDARRPDPPLGLGSLLPDTGAVDVFPFRKGDVLLLYTDGVVEARDARGSFYPLAERVASWRHTWSPDHLVDRIHGELTAHTDGTLDDDVALLAVRRTA